MKRAFLFMMIALLGLGYYSKSRPTEIADRVLVHAVGIDETEDGYSVIMQVFAPDGSGGDTPLDPSQPNVRLVSGSGETVAEAVSECRGKLGGELFFGQDRVILFGRDTDLSRTDELCGFFLSTGETFLNIDCAAAYPTAEKILSLPVTAGSVASERFVRMIRSGEDSGSCCRCTFTELLAAMDTPSQTVILPEFAKTKAEKKKDGKTIEAESPLTLGEGAEFVGGRYSAKVSPDDMALIAAVSGRGRHFRSGRKQPDGTEMLFRVRSREVTAVTDGDVLIVSVKLRVAPASAKLFSSPSERELTDKISAEAAERRINALCERVCSEGCADLLGADMHLRRFAPSLYRSLTPEARRLSVRYSVTIC